MQVGGHVGALGAVDGEAAGAGAGADVEPDCCAKDPTEMTHKATVKDTCFKFLN
jgi:hypothetical protein